MRTYTLTIRDECGDWGDAPDISASSPAVAMRRAWEYVESNIGNGDYGQEENGGARVRVYVEIRAGNGPTHEKSREIDIEPDHDYLIRKAGGDTDCDHSWTSEGEGGCTENPGVWATGGTSLTFRSHCRHCGLIRIERSTGSQHNPGEADTVEYQLPESGE